MKHIKLFWIVFVILFLGCARPAALNGSDTINTTIVFDNTSARITGPGAEFSNGLLTINQAGTYVLSGNLNNGRILTNVTRTDTVRFVLNGVYLHSETGPVIHAPRSREIIIILEEGTENTINDGIHSRNEEHNSAIFVQHDLIIQGNGTLTVNGNYRHGIRAQDFLTLESGRINVTALGHAIRGRDGVIINNGILTLNAGDDGIQSNNPNSEDVGYITITGGTFDIRAANDGIQAESTLSISGGTFNIVTGGGNANAPPRAIDFGGRGGLDRRGGFQLPQTQTGESESMKGLKARTLLYVSDGNFTIDAADDGIHSDSDIHIAGGTFVIKTGDDGIHADSNILISGGNINILESYEGIEGITITITGGNIRVFARDDGMNAAGSRSLNDMFIRITGGNIDVYALRDGIDSNGHIFLENGALRVSGPSMIMEGAIDLDGQFIVTGGELITAGSVQTVSSNSTQPVILLSYSRQHPSGALISIRDRNGNTLLEYTSETAFSYSGLTSPNFRTGETYTLFINGSKETDIQLGSTITAISDTGGAYNAGMRGRGEMPQGSAIPPGGMMPRGVMPGSLPQGGRGRR